MTDRTEPPTKVVLHVGAHKTGTSLVQKFLRDTPKYAAANRITYVSRSDTNDLIGWGKVPIRQPELLADRLRAEERAHPGNAIVISHENSLGRPFIPGEPGLYPHAGRCAEGLRRATEGFDVRVVLYTRPVDDFAESYYLQTINEGASHSFAEWVRQLEPSSWRWAPVVRALDRTFGERHVLIGDFAEIAEGQQAMLARFFERVQLAPPAGFTYQPIRNPSISARGLALALDVNPLLRPGESHVVRKFIQKHFSNQKFDRARPLPDSVRATVGAGDHPDLTARARRDLVRAGDVGAGDVGAADG